MRRHVISMPTKIFANHMPSNAIYPTRMHAKITLSTPVFPALLNEKKRRDNNNRNIAFSSVSLIWLEMYANGWKLELLAMMLQCMRLRQCTIGLDKANWWELQYFFRSRYSSIHVSFIFFHMRYRHQIT